MFARRKHRPQEEDEPLVPHGLIWQATDDEPEQSADPAALVTPQVQAEPIEIPSRTDTRIPENAAAPRPLSRVPEPISRPVDSNPSKLGAISPPIRWPSLKTASVIRRVAPAPVPLQPSVTDSKPAPEVSVAQKLTPPVQVTAQPKLEQVTAKLPTAPQMRRLEIIELELETKDGSQEKSQLREAVVRVVGSLRHRAASIHAGTVRSVGHARRKLQTVFGSIHLRARLEHARPMAERCVRGVVAGSLSAREICRSWWTSNVPRMARLKSSAGTFSSLAMKNSAARSADFAQRVRSHRVRIRIVESARAQALIQRGKLAWATRTAAVRRDSRLWTSLAMAALSALLTLGLISAVRPYSPGRNSSNSTSRSEQSPIEPTSLIAPPTALASTRQTTKPRRNNAAAQKPTPAKPSSVATQSKPNPVTRPAHHNDDEDYVAPNSYHYYGNTGKSR